MSLTNRVCSLLLALVLAVSAAGPALSQGTATVRGTVTRAGDREPLAGVLVSVRGTTLSTFSNAQGRYVLYQVPSGQQTIVFRWLGYAPTDQTVTVRDGLVVDAAMEPKAINLADITVTAASREPERIVEAPAAVTSIEPYVLQTTAPTGQAPLALAASPGVDIVQSGINDFNINARGFNSSLNRRVLTLLDGRDLAIAFLGSQEWSTLPTSTDNLKTMELVRGPGSALYGPNAFAGVLNMTTLSPREAPGGRISVSGGELSSFRTDARWASVFGEGLWGVRLTGGYGTNDTWSRSRTSADGLDLRREYAPALGSDSMETKPTSPEAVPLHGQTLDLATRGALGDRDPVKTIYGTARIDRYLDNGAVITAEGGAAQAENETLVTGIGRVQVIKGLKPFGRLAYNSDHVNVFGYWNRRDSKDPQISLASGAELIEKSNIFHVEAQGNTRFADQKARVVGGASFREYDVNTEGTLMRPEDDDRHDKMYAAYGQAEYKMNDQVRLVAAARYDKGDLFDGQFSPKGAIVYSPSPNHSFRFTVNRAFQTPNYSEFYLRAAAAPPANFSLLEAGLRANPQLGPALAGVPNGTLFTNSAAVPVYARGNADLKVEKVFGYEVGYKGALADRVYVTVDAYLSTLKDFVTDLLPGVNPTFAYWTPPAAVPAQARAPLVGAIKSTLAANPATALAAAGLTRTEDGNTAIVVSYTNAGKVNQNGIDVGIGVQLAPELRLDGSFSYFHFTVKDSLTGDKLVPNTPKTKGTVTLAYIGHNGIDASASARLISGYDWSAGVFSGRIPSSQSVNVSAGYQIHPRYRLFTEVTNVFDQKRFQLYGGAVIGRRALAGLTATF
jgi:iron complex outermembrane receptor protein